MSECVLCNKPIKGGIPRWVIDWDTLKVEGQAHTRCVKKGNRYQDTRFYPTETPRPELIAFSAKLRHFIITTEKNHQGEKWGDSYEFYQYMLANEALFKASTREEWIHLDRVLELTDWWLNGSKIITQEQYNSLFEWIESFDISKERAGE